MNWTRRLLKEQTGPDQIRPGQGGERPFGTEGGTLESTASKAGESVTLTKAERLLMILLTGVRGYIMGILGRRRQRSRRAQVDDQSFEDKAAAQLLHVLKK